MHERKVAIVTGASSGIGRETALALARRGYATVLAARRPRRLERLADCCRRAGAEALVQPTDVTSYDQVHQLVRRTVDAFGRVDVMVNNAGVGQAGRVCEITDAEMRAVFDVNFFGVFYGCRAVAPVMMRQKGGHIFNLSSVIGKRGSPFHGGYCASKFAVAGLTDSLRVEMKPCGVHVTCVLPALTRTEFFHDAEKRARIRSRYTRPEKMTPPAQVARRIVRVIGRPCPEIVITPGGKILTLIAALAPALADRIMQLYHDDLVGRSARGPRARGRGPGTERSPHAHHHR